MSLEGITEILEPGGQPAPGEANEFLVRCTKETESAGERGLLVISGRLPSGVAPSLYTSLIEAARANGVESFIDTSGEALRVSVEAKPKFVKTNRAEAEELIGKPLKTIQDAEAAARRDYPARSRQRCHHLGRRRFNLGRKQKWARVESAAASPESYFDGRLRRCDYGRLCPAPRLKESRAKEAIRLAAACGAANCSAEAPGRIELATVRALLPQIEVQTTLVSSQIST